MGPVSSSYTLWWIGWRWKDTSMCWEWFRRQEPNFQARLVQSSLSLPLHTFQAVLFEQPVLLMHQQKGGTPLVVCNKIKQTWLNLHESLTGTTSPILRMTYSAKNEIASMARNASKVPRTNLDWFQSAHTRRIIATATINTNHGVGSKNGISHSALHLKIQKHHMGKRFMSPLEVNLVSVNIRNTYTLIVLTSVYQ